MRVLSSLNMHKQPLFRNVQGKLSRNMMFYDNTNIFVKEHIEAIFLNRFANFYG